MFKVNLTLIALHHQEIWCFECKILTLIFVATVFIVDESYNADYRLILSLRYSSLIVVKITVTELPIGEYRRYEISFFSSYVGENLNVEEICWAE